MARPQNPHGVTIHDSTLDIQMIASVNAQFFA